MDIRVPEVRRFSRSVSQFIGALNDHYLGRDRPLSEARLLFEIGAGGAEVRDLRARLSLDSGYMSRLLRSLERQGLIALPEKPGDRRVRCAKLTRAGKAELQVLNRRSDALAQSMLDPLTERQRERLVAAMNEVQRLLTAAAAVIELEPSSSADARYCLGEYYRELAERFDAGFDAAKALSVEEDEVKPPKGAFLVIRANGTPIGCGAFKPMSTDAAYIKRMWIAQSARGLGLGRRLLEALETRARAAGYSIARLETNKSLKEAQRMYKACGYREVSPFNDEPYAHHWFEKRLG